MKARSVIEAETPKKALRQSASTIRFGTLSPEKIKKARAVIAQRYGTLDFDIVSLSAAALRTGSPHQEFVQGGRARCKICGYVDGETMPDPIFHPEWWL